MAAANNSYSAIWLCSYPDGALRVGGRANRSTFALPAPQWLRDVLVTCAGPGVETANLRELGGGYDKNINVDRPVPRLHALLKISNHQCTYYESSLTSWSDECRLLWEYFKSPLNAYSFKVEDIYHCQVVQDVRLKRGFRQGGGGASAVNLGRCVFIPYLGDSLHHIMLQRAALPFHWSCSQSVARQGDDDEGDAVLSSDSDDMIEVDVEEAAAGQPGPPVLQASLCTQVLATWHIDLDAADVPAILLPEPVTFLILAGRWHDVVSVQSATDLGMQQCWGLANPKAACKPRPDCALEDASEYELLRMMLDVGWHWEPWSSAKKIPLALREFPNEYRRGGEKIWRTTGVQLHRNYLMALLRSEDLENAPCFM